MVKLGPTSERVFTVLRQEIVQGKLPALARLPTEYDLSARFAVSRSTVRKVLQRLAAEGLIDSRTKSGSHVRARPAESMTQVVSLMYSGVGDLLTVVQDAAMRHGCLLNLYSQQRMAWAPELEATFLDLVLAQRHQALLAFCSPLPPRNEERLERLEAAGVRVVHVEPDSIEIPRRSFLMPDYARAGYLAVTSLLLAGFSRIYYVGMPGDGPVLQLIMKGIGDAFRDHVGAQWTMEQAYVEKPDGCKPSDFAWLAAQFKGRCGIVSGSYGRARTVTEALAAAGREVPSGVRVVAVCNNSDTAHPNDPFDHIIFDRKAMYERIVDLVCVQDFAGIRELVPPCLVRVGTAASSPTPGQP